MRTAPLATIVLIALVGLGRIIWHPEGLFNRHSDLVAAHLTTQNVLYRSWQAEHRLPLWRSDILSGQPALTNPQATFTHPVHVLFALFSPDHIVGLVLWLHLLIGAFGAYYAGVRLRLSVPARVMLAASMLFSFKTILAVYAGWLPVVTAISALPLLFGTAARALERPDVRSSLMLGGASALALHAGHLQLTYYAALFSAAWATLSIAGRVSKGEHATGWRIARTLTLALLIAIGLSAHVLLPLTIDFGLGTRPAATYEFFLRDTPAYGVHLLTVFNPELLGTPLDGTFVEGWEYIAFVGGVTSLLAFLGATRGRHQPLVPVLLWALGISVLLSLNTPLLALVFKVVPGYSIFRLPARMLFLSAFFVCCLAGVGLDCALSTMTNPASRKRLVVLAIGLVTLEGSVWARRYLSTPEPIPPVTHADYTAALVSDRGPARVAPMTSSTPDGASASAMGLQLTTGYDPLVMSHYQTYIELVQFNHALEAHPGVWTEISGVARLDLLAALNVLYLVSSRPVELPPTDFSLLRSFDSQPQFRFYEGIVKGPVYVYKNLRFLPRAFFVSNVINARDEGAAINAIQQADVRENAVVVAPAAGGSSASSAGDQVDIGRSEAGILDISTRNEGPRFLLVSEVWHPGWSAKVDGHAVPIVRADVALLGLWLPPGNHRIEIRFWPPGLSAGLITTGITILGVLLLLVRLAVQPPVAREQEP